MEILRASKITVIIALLGIFVRCRSAMQVIPVDPAFNCAASQVDQESLSVLDTVVIDHIDSTDIVVNLKWYITYDSLTERLPNFDQEIAASMERLNEDWQGTIRYSYDSIQYYIHNRRDIDYYRGNLELERSELRNLYNEEGSISVFILPTNNNLLGYARLLTSWHDGYAVSEPSLDFVMVSRDGLRSVHDWSSEKGSSTLTHEIGHFFSLDHAFDNCINYMSYNCYRSEFTAEQLEQMLKFLITYRSYLIQ